ncbi:hypothetical protein F441_21479 [Phytophthora nicotianae CJ01A1]|uniref:Uncharacterized protein n=1 Tax=Phytophthora nicotianae CJ01A1 TaxID=1317063 RepID=W2VSE6_PHYNI|nr:hypothetical protein F441_21479 [Phytophthora nicotianae CJ01A1]
MRRAAFLKIYRPQFSLSEDVLQELATGIMAWGDVMLKTVHSFVLDSAFQTQTRLKLGKDALALVALTQALTLDPQNDKYLQNRGLMYRRMGQFVEAQDEYCKREVTSGTHTASTGSTLTKRGDNDVLFLICVADFEGKRAIVQAGARPCC